MKSVYLLLLIAVLTACTTPKSGTPTVKPTPPHVTPPIPPGPDKNDPIKPEKDKVFFGAKEDIIVVNTKGDFWDMYVSIDAKEYFLPQNLTRDTVETTWSKAIVLPHTAYIDDSGKHHYLAKQIKLIVFDNDTGKERWCSAELFIGTMARISILYNRLNNKNKKQDGNTVLFYLSRRLYYISAFISFIISAASFSAAASEALSLYIRIIGSVFDRRR